MFDPRQVVAVVITLHPGVLLASLLFACIATLAFAFFLKATQARRPILLAGLLFFGVLLASHVVLSRMARLYPAIVETISIQGDDLVPADEAR